MENEDMYHYDFTTASELEIFIARIEEIIQEWRVPQKPIQCKLEKDDFKTKEWCMNSEKITFADAEFQLFRYYLQCSEDKDAVEERKSEIDDGSFSQAVEDMLSMENDFFPIVAHPMKDSHPLARWYGLRDFLVLVPKLGVLVASESQIKLWLSSLCIATSNTGCQVPVFLQAKEPWQFYFVGVCQSKGFHTDFEMIHLEHLPLHWLYLTGLLTIFKSKINPKLIFSPVIISVRCTYVLKDWTLSNWTQSPPDMGFLDGELIGVSGLGKLPFGAVFDPILGLNLYATWPYLVENTVVDSDSYSDLDPMHAITWTASINIAENLNCFLTEYFTEFLSLCNNTHTIQDILGNIADCSNSRSYDLSSSLSAITESKISAFSKAVIGTGKNPRKQSYQVEQFEGPISTDILMMLLYYLFPDADSECKSPYPEQYSGNSNTFIEEDKSVNCNDPRLNGMKSAPYNSLPWRLAIVMAHVIHSLGGLPSAAHLWYEFTKELRFRCEHNILIPGLEPSFPDPRTCLLNQKLQLLNCCISRMIERDNRAKKGDDDSDSDEEFYDCSSDAEGGQDETKKRKNTEKPTGRLARHGELRLLETGEYLYIPKTQDPIPKTEDQLEEDAEVLLQLGTDAHGSELRARLMSASLLSDMEAFKAANPGCILADFIRWYSPRDWIEDESTNEFGQPNGHLSSRMQIPGNTWLEVWEIAKPTPTKWQKRLFDDTRECEKVLDFLEQQGPDGFIQLLLPVLSACVTQKIIEESALYDLSGVSEIIAKLIKKIERLQRSPNTPAERYKELINDIFGIEMLLDQAKSLNLKLAVPTLKEDCQQNNSEEYKNFIRNLLTGAETEVPGGPKSGIRSIIRSYFEDAAKMDEIRPDSSNALYEQVWNASSPFRCPYEKEIILRLSTSKGPQRLHAVLKKNDYRLCGAFTKDDTFF